MPRKDFNIRLDDAISFYLSGQRAQTAARSAGVDDKRLLQALRERGLLRSKKQSFALKSGGENMRRHLNTGICDKTVAQRYLAGESQWDLARAFGVSRQVILTSLKNAGVAPRSSHDGYLLHLSKIPLSERPVLFRDRESERIQDIKNAEAVALGRQRNLNSVYVSPSERLLAQWLKEKNIPIIQQQAIGPYNIDIGTFPVAVEVWGGTWHFHRDHSERFKYLFDRGWNLLIIFVETKRSPLTIGAADYIVSYLQETASNPTVRSEYRVIWGEGKLFARSGSDCYKLTRIVPRRGFQYTGA